MGLDDNTEEPVISRLWLRATVQNMVNNSINYEGHYKVRYKSYSDDFKSEIQKWIKEKTQFYVSKES